ncbi:MAG: hypothetical protein LBK03_08815, partial [Bacteroidales bacterium]|nr:hypothetical protein [Bacteroidales bacterium]
VIRYQYDNHLGSACLELDDTGDIISYEEYHPFGTTSYRSGRTEIEVSLKRYKYCGKERDEETGLYYYGMRYYAAWLCRFVSVDPLQFKYPHYTPYQYAGNKPITFIDLDGGEEDKPRTHTEINTFTNIQPINTYTKNGNTYQSVDYSFYQTTTTTDSETSMVYSAQESLSAQLTLRFISPSGEWALESVDSYTHNLTETFIENTTPTTDNSWGVMDYIHLGLDLVGLIPVVGEFFDAANALEIAETTLKESRNLWQLTEKGSLSIKHHSKYGNFYKGTDNLWWSVDKAKHGDSSFKVFQEKDKGLEWIHNADKYGDFITNQHKSNTGQFIPWKNLNTVK